VCIHVCVYACVGSMRNEGKKTALCESSTAEEIDTRTTYIQTPIIHNDLMYNASVTYLALGEE
jgi:hypothetical protein